MTRQPNNAQDFDTKSYQTKTASETRIDCNKWHQIYRQIHRKHTSQKYGTYNFFCFTAVTIYTLLARLFYIVLNSITYNKKILKFTAY